MIQLGARSTNAKALHLRALVLALAAVLLGSVPQVRASDRLPFQPFSADAYEAARRGGRPFVVEFSAEWCTPCKEMEERTFTDPRVLGEAHGFTFLTVDMTESTRLTELILESFKVVGAPTTLFFRADGKEHTRRIGFIGPEAFAEILSQTRAAAEQPGPKPAGAVRRGV